MIRENNRNRVQNRERVDLNELIEKANKDKLIRTHLKNFEGDNFCIKTEERVAYLTVQEDGSIVGYDGIPPKCIEISTSEEYLNRAWEKVQNKEMLYYDGIKENVKIPWKFKLKLAWSGIIKNVT